MRKYIRARKERRRTLLTEMLGGKCARCGSTERLEFDHIDPSTKRFGICSDLSRAWADLLEEVAKCQLLCKPCHVAKGREDRPEVPHGLYRYEYYRCRCEVCRAANSIVAAEKRERSAQRSRARANVSGTLDHERSGVAQLAEHSAVNRIVVGSNPTAGADDGGLVPAAKAWEKRGPEDRRIRPPGPQPGKMCDPASGNEKSAG